MVTTKPIKLEKNIQPENNNIFNNTCILLLQ